MTKNKPKEQMKKIAYILFQNLQKSSLQLVFGTLKEEKK